MSNSWYPRYYGDYMRDTGLLSLVQHGAYTCLLDHYYATGAPIPDNIDAVCRMCRAVSGEEQEAVKAVLTMFFTLADDGYHNARADREIAKANAISTARAEAGSAGAKSKWQKHGKRHGKKMAIATTSTSTSTSTPTVTPTPKTKTTQPDGRGQLQSFGEFQKVRISEKEHDRLIEKHGKARTDIAIDVLDSYLAAKGKKYANHYAVLKEGSWVWDRVSERESKGGGAPRELTEDEQIKRRANMAEMVAILKIRNLSDEQRARRDELMADIRKTWGQKTFQECEIEALEGMP